MVDLQTLNPEQRKGVETTSGPVLILAGAGSGKTRVLTFRIAYLIQTGLARPSEILAVTFTNKAASEMKERIAKLLDIKGDLRYKFPWMGTFHSVCVRILREHGEQVGLSRNYTIYDSNDQVDTIKRAMKDLNLSIKDFNPRAIQSHISNAKNELIGPEEYKKFADSYFLEVVAKVYPRYQQILKESNAVDFDDLLMMVVKLFRENINILNYYQDIYRYILIDEYQDTNGAQYQIVNMLAEKHKNLCVVGDDDQSIYSFRGATIKNILNFERDYPNAEVIKLEQNYRSTKNILDAAYFVVKSNVNRTDKRLWTEKGSGQKIVVYKAQDQVEEANWVSSNIQELKNQGVDLDEVAILYRTNAQSRSLEEVLVRKAIPYRIVGGLKFYDRKEIKDIIAYLKMVYNPSDSQAIRRIINVPKRGIGSKSLDDLFATAEARGMHVSDLLLQSRDLILNKNVKTFADLFFDLKNSSKDLNTVELINYVLEKSGYIKMLKDGTTENESRIENIKELLSVASKFTSLSPEEGLATFMEEVSLLQDGAEEDSESKVTLMTVHASKGLEFIHVYVVGMEEGLFPHNRVFTNPKELEEERRLAYVAITRAKESLSFVHTNSRLYFGSKQRNSISRFIEEIPEEFLQFESSNVLDGWDVWEEDQFNDYAEIPILEKGDKVKHEYFGAGNVISVNDYMVKIDFGSIYGVKELALELAPIKKV